MSDRRFPPPWTVEDHNDACFIVKDRNGYALAYVHYEEEPGRRSAASRGKLTNAKLTIRALSFLGSSVPVCDPTPGLISIEP